MTTTNWHTRENGEETSEVIDFGLVDVKGRRIGTKLDVQPNNRWELVDGEWTRFPAGTFSYAIQGTRNGVRFGGIPRHTGDFATIAEAKAAAELAAERSRKAQARKFGATVEEAWSKQAIQAEKAAAKSAAWWAARAATQAPAAPAIVEAPAVEGLKIEVEIEVDQEITRFRGYRGPDGELRFRKVEAAPVEVAPVAKELPRCRNCGVTFDPAVEGVADVFVACGPCRHGQLEPGEEPDCRCHRDPALFPEDVGRDPPPASA